MSLSVLIPIAEQFGLIAGIGQWVLERAWADRLRWTPRAKTDDFATEVNVSPHQLMAPGFVDLVAGVVATEGADPGLLQLEITESVFLRDEERAKVVLSDLKALGVGLTLDDFGAGTSSHSYLMNFPVDVVKIDREFIANLGERRASRAIMAAVIALAHDLDMTVTGEGVENVSQHQQLTELGCDSCQGYYFARPMPAATFDSFVQHH